MSKKMVWIAILLVSLVLFSSSIQQGAYQRSDDISSVPCLGCLGLNLRSKSDFTFESHGEHPDFVLDSLEDSVVFIKYRTDACSACDEMEPVVEELQNEFTSVEFVHINLDHASKMRRESYKVYDLKGGEDKMTGVPMFVVMTLEEKDGELKPYFKVSYGIQEKGDLADDLQHAIDVYPYDNSLKEDMFVELELKTARLSISPGQTKKVQLSIENRGNSTVDVSVKLNRTHDWPVNLKNNLSLQSGEKRTEYVSITCPENTTLGAKSHINMSADVSDKRYNSTSMGLVCIVKEDSEKPKIKSVDFIPDEPKASDELKILVSASDDEGIEHVNISYYECTDELCTPPKTSTLEKEDDNYSGVIGPFDSEYKYLHLTVEVTDINGNTNVSSEYEIVFQEEQKKEETSLSLLPITLGFTVALLITHIKRRWD